MNSNPLFSIITIVLNGEKTIQKAIDSLSNQSFKDFEYIVIEGGSSDGTVALLNKNENRIDKLINQDGVGISNAFNEGINNSSGKIIGFLNADDWYESNALEIVNKCFINNGKAKGIYCGATRFHSKNDIQFVAQSNPDILVKETSVHHSSTFITKGVFTEIGDFNPSFNLAMDYDLFIRALNNNISFYRMNETIANRSLDGASYKNYRIALKETLNARSPFINKWKNYSIYLVAFVKEWLAQKIRNQKILSGIYQKYWKRKNMAK